MLKKIGSFTTMLILASMGAVSAATYSGTLIDVAQYVTGDQGAVSVSGMLTMHEAMSHGAVASPHPMMGGMQSGMGGMSGHAGMMRACMGSLALLTKDGVVHLLLSRQGTVLPQLCGKNGSRVQISGETMEKGGVSAIVVDSLRFP